MSDDLISRQAAIEAIDAVFPVDPMKSEYAQGRTCGAALAKIYVELLPSVQLERNKGKWIVDVLADNIYRCSECGVDAPVEPTGGTEYKSNYCPNCGAKMEKENKKMKQLLERVITANGINKQLDVAIEELSELLQAICKIKRREPDECLNEDYLINLAEEMADVEIILAELKLLFDNEDNVKEWKNYKLDRLEKRLKEKSGFEIMSGVYDLSE